MGTSGLIFALLRRVLPYIYIRSLDSTWLAKGMAFTSPESDLDSSLDGQLISSPWEGTSHYPSLPETNQVLYPAWLPLLQILISFPIRTFHFLLSSPTPPPPPPPPRYVGFFNRRFTFFLREVDNIWLFEQVFWRALTKKRWLTLTLTLPTHHHHQGMVGFLTGGLHFSSEKGSDKNIWLWIPAILTRVGAWVQVKTGTSPH